MEEIWKDIKGYEGLYQISNLGKVKSLSKQCRYSHSVTNKTHYRITKEKILCNRYCKGYKTIQLQNKQFRICRLVAIHFIDNPQNKPCVNHIDGNKKNDTINNLEWVTYSENMKHAVNNDLINLKGLELGRKKIKVKCTLTNVIFSSIEDFAKHKKVSSTTISRSLSGYYKTNYNVKYA
jgi:hypothetical protein